jgi:hypothetical protein
MNHPIIVMAGLDPAICLKLHQIPGSSPGMTNCVAIELQGILV